MKRNLKRRQSTRLHLESLEARRLLAVAAYQLELYDDDGGVPGALISDSSVRAGDTFFVRITAEEFDPFRTGIKTASVNVDWDAGLLEVVDADFNLDSVITPDLPLFHSGKLNQSSGSIRDLSGTAMLSSQIGRAIGNAMAETFAMIHMRAGSKAGTAKLELSRSQAIETATVPLMVMTKSSLRFDSESISILPVDEPSTEPETTSTTESNILDSKAEIETPTAVLNPPTHVATTPVTSIEPMTGELTQPAVDPVSLPEIAAPEIAAPEIGITEIEAPVIEVTETPVPAQTPQIAHAPILASISFDMNGDGVFDLADFGWLNVSAAQATQPVEVPLQDQHEVTESADVEPTLQPTLEVAEPILHSICTAAPSGDSATVEAWMDALAQAWIADADARERRRREVSRQT